MGEKEQINIVISEIENGKWYSDIIYYLKSLTFPDHLVDHKRISLMPKAMKYCLIENGLGCVILRCVNKEEADKLVVDLHSWYCGGHFSARTTTHKILRAGYYCTTIFYDTHRYVRSC